MVISAVLINNPSNKGWPPYAYGLRSEIYNLSGNVEVAGKDFLKYNNCPDAYFLEYLI